MRVLHSCLLRLTPEFITWLYALVFCYSAHAQVVNSIENTDPRFTYFPSVCNATDSETPDTPSCAGQWQIIPVAGAASGTVTSIFSPPTSNTSLSIVPQFFLRIRGSSLSLHTSSFSNATANITLSASPSGTSITTTVDTSVGVIDAVDLPEDEDMELSVVWVPPETEGEVTRLDVDVVIVTADNSSVTSLTPLPSPISSAVPSFVIPTSTATATSISSNHLAQPVGTIVGETLAGFFGLILLLIATYIFVMRRRGRWKWWNFDNGNRRKEEEGGEAYEMTNTRTRSGIGRRVRDRWRFGGFASNRDRDVEGLDMDKDKGKGKARAVLPPSVHELETEQPHLWPEDNIEPSYLAPGAGAVTTPRSAAWGWGGGWGGAPLPVDRDRNVLSTNVSGNVSEEGMSLNIGRAF